jgi:hypothetical protein
MPAKQANPKKRANKFVPDDEVKQIMPDDDSDDEDGHTGMTMCLVGICWLVVDVDQITHSSCEAKTQEAAQEDNYARLAFMTGWW